MMRRLPEMVIGRASVPGHPTERARLRCAFGRMLAAADFWVPGTPPSEILLVRELCATADLGGILALSDGEAGRLRGRIAALRCAAARPRDGRIPATAEAVLFSDAAELAACIALALAENRNLQLWWQRAAARLVPDLIRHVDPGRVIAARAEQAPAVITALDAWGAAETVLRAASPAALRCVVSAVVAAYRLDPPAATIEWVPRQPSSVPAHRATPPRWMPVEDLGSTADSPPEARWLLAAVRVLHPRPQLACDAAFQRWLASRAVSPPPDEPGCRAASETAPYAPRGRIRRPDRDNAVSAAPELNPEWQSTAPPEESSPLSRIVLADWPQTLRDAGLRAGEASPLSPLPAPGSNWPQSPPGWRKRSQPSHEPAPPERANLLDAGHPEPAALRDGAAADAQNAATPASHGGLGTATSLGGVFYLWRLISALDLSEVAADWRMPEALGGWALLESAARAVLGGSGVEHDPIWLLLAELDGRAPEEAVGAGMRQPQELRLPTAWLADAPKIAAAPRWRVEGRRLRIWSEAGTPLSDLPVGDAVPDAVAAELARLGVAGAADPATGSAPGYASPAPGPAWHPAPALSRWLGFFGPAIRARLAMEVDRAPEALAGLLSLEARIHVSLSHVDVVARAEHASVAIRRAGLDIDPGWVPSLGRVLLFHYK
jgi:hypothetical protein